MRVRVEVDIFPYIVKWIKNLIKLQQQQPALEDKNL